jgi:hypothetical protein
MRPAQAAREAREVVAELTGNPAEQVTGLHRNGEGWVVTVEVLEVSRVPSTMDLLGTYDVTIGDDGEVAELRRRRRYHRGAAEEED